MRHAIAKSLLPFVAVRALFGIKFIGGHPENVVALRADTMDKAGGGQTCFCRLRLAGIW